MSLKVSKERVARMLANAGACTFVISMFLMLQFYIKGKPAPDTASGDIFPIQAHGMLYVQPAQGRLFYGLLLAAAIMIAASSILQSWDRIIALFRRKQ